MFTSDKELIESRGYIIVKLGGTERAVKNPLVFVTSEPQPNNLTRAFMEYLRNQPIVFLTSRTLTGKTPEERDVLMVKLINS